MRVRVRAVQRAAALAPGAPPLPLSGHPLTPTAPPWKPLGSAMAAVPLPTFLRSNTATPPILLHVIQNPALFQFHSEHEPRRVPAALGIMAAMVSSVWLCWALLKELWHNSVCVPYVLSQCLEAWHCCRGCRSRTLHKLLQPCASALACQSL